MEIVWIPIELFFAAIAGVLFVLLPGLRRRKQREWEDMSPKDVRNEVIGWLVCSCVAIVLVAIVLKIALQ